MERGIAIPQLGEQPSFGATLQRQQAPSTAGDGGQRCLGQCRLVGAEDCLAQTRPHLGFDLVERRTGRLLVLRLDGQTDIDLTWMG